MSMGNYPPSGGGGGDGWGGPPPGGGWSPPPAPGGGWGGPPPGGGYGPPPGAPLVPYSGPSAVQERNSVLVMLLPFLTCGVYLFYWLYKTSDELRQQTGDTSINPTLDLVLSLVSCGLWGMYVEYRNTQKVHAMLVAHDPYHKDQSQTVLILNVAALFVGLTGFVATYLVQEELNQLARRGPPALPR